MMTTVCNPLDLPEIRFRISLYLNPADCLSCILVCKAWRHDFVYPLWHSVDFLTQGAILKVPSATIQQYGHHIRVVKELFENRELDFLEKASCSQLAYFRAEFGHSVGLEARCLDFLERHMVTLQQLDLHAESTSRGRYGLMECIENNIPARIFQLGPEVLLERNLKGLPLKRLFLRNIWMTRGEFSEILEACPNLRNLWLHTVSVVEDPISPPKPLFQHQRLSNFGCNAQTAMSPDPNSSEAPSLFAQFPKLEFWRMTRKDISQSPRLGQELKRSCPRLKGVDFDAVDPAQIPALITTTFVGLRNCELPYLKLDLSVIAALLIHGPTLRRLKFYDDYHLTFDRVDPSPVTPHLVDFGRVVQLLPQKCPRLLDLTAPTIEMDIDHVLAVPWGCTELEELRVRIKGLDTPELIDGALDRWVDARLAGVVVVEEDMDEGDELVSKVECLDLNESMSVEDDSLKEAEDIESIQDKAVRHLVQLKKLRVVWLGTREVFI